MFVFLPEHVWEVGHDGPRVLLAVSQGDGGQGQLRGSAHGQAGRQRGQLLLRGHQTHVTLGGHNQGCGSGSKLDQYLGTLWIQIRFSSKDPDPYMSIEDTLEAKGVRLKT